MLEMNVKPVRKSKIFACRQNGRNAFVVNIRHFFVGSEHHDDVGKFRRLFYGTNFEPRLLRLRVAFAALFQSDDDVHAAVF